MKQGAATIRTLICLPQKLFKKFQNNKKKETHVFVGWMWRVVVVADGSGCGAVD